MPEHEPWLTALFNEHLGWLANMILSWVGLRAANPDKPWSTYVVMELLVAAIIILVFAILRPRLSMDRPGKLQHGFELIYNFLHEQSEDVVGHRGRQYLAFFGTLFIFILFANLLGVIPTLESPTMFPAVPLGCALSVFAYYNFVGLQAHGMGPYLKHFAGPMPALAPLMIPIEIISNLARPLSLTIRLYANMYAGEQVTLAFLALTYLIVPVAFMGLHVFVAFLQAYVFALLTMVYVSDVLPHDHAPAA
jgi:F-type H+-transporting ATPase subunit a